MNESTTDRDPDTEATGRGYALDHISCEVRDAITAGRDRQSLNCLLAEFLAHDNSGVRTMSVPPVYFIVRERAADVRGRRSASRLMVRAVT